MPAARRLLRVLVLSGWLAGLLVSRCPNDCNGHGTCDCNDACVCDRMFGQGDCSVRWCPYDYAFVATPQGDFNFDGDQLDNSFKYLARKAPQDELDGTPLVGSMTELDDILTIHDATSHILTTPIDELHVGDSVWYNGATFDIDAIVSPGFKYQLDRRVNESISNQPVYRFLEIPDRPGGHWEMWRGDHHADDEGHFMMECSNKGTCNRQTGQCQCFDGFSGLACTRMECPLDCSGKGLCLSQSQLTERVHRLMTFTVATTAGSKSVYASAAQTELVPGYSLKVPGYDPIEIDTVYGDGTAITLKTAFPDTLPFTTPVYRVHKYRLWDGKKVSACLCDDWYEGAACTFRKCPKGDDPLIKHTDEVLDSTSTSATSPASSYPQNHERQTLTIDSLTGSGYATGHIRLVFTDVNGHEWTSRRIEVYPKLSKTAKVLSGTPTIVTFDGELVYEEVAVGDKIRVNRQIRTVASIAYAWTQTNTTEVPPITAVTVDAAFTATAGYMQSSGNPTESGTFVYRHGPGGDLRAALRELPEGFILDMDVDAMSGGTLVTQPGHTSSSATTITFPSTGPATTELSVGDLVRSQAGDVRNVASVTDTSSDGDIDAVGMEGGLGATVASSAATFAAGGAFYRYNGFRYRLGFKHNTGEVPLMRCDKTGLHSATMLTVTGRVTRAAPNTVSFYAMGGGTSGAAGSGLPTGEGVAVGTYIRVGGQVRRVTATTAGGTGYYASVTVLRAFTANADSSTDDLILRVTPVEKLNNVPTVPFTSTAYQQCHLTKMPELQFVGAATTVTVSDDGYGTRQAIRASSGSTHFLMDDDYIAIGRRVTLRKSAGVYETRTIDNIFQSTVLGVKHHTVIHFTSPFSATHAGVVAYVNDTGTTENLPCSRKGLCNDKTGLCDCFEGYNGRACSVQNALAT